MRWIAEALANNTSVVLVGVAPDSSGIWKL